MALNSVEIHNFKSIKASGPIQLGPMNVLIGANASKQICKNTNYHQHTIRKFSQSILGR